MSDSLLLGSMAASSAGEHFENLIPVELVVLMSVSALCDEETHQTMIAIAMTGWLYRSITVPTCIFGLRIRDKKYYFGFVSA